MPRVIGNYMTTQRKDGHYYVRLQDGAHICSNTFGDHEEAQPV